MIARFRLHRVLSDSVSDAKNDRFSLRNGFLSENFHPFFASLTLSLRTQCEQDGEDLMLS